MPFAPYTPGLGPSVVPSDELWRLGDGEPWVLDGWLGIEAAMQVRDAVLEVDARGELRAAGLGRSRTVRRHLRSDRHAWIDPLSADPRLGALLERLRWMQDQLNREAYLGLRRFEVQAATYDDGVEGYVRHCDALDGGAAGPRRRVTAIYYANPNWSSGDGGRLACWPSSGLRMIEPLADRLVVFLSERLEHAVERVIRGPRVAVTAWYWGP